MASDHPYGKVEKHTQRHPIQSMMIIIFIIFIM
jgi:hypothetical protein